LPLASPFTLLASRFSLHASLCSLSGFISLMGKPFRWLLVAAVLLTGIWYVTSPRRAWDRFLGAIVMGQEAELQATIDFPTLRDNLRVDLRAAMSQRSDLSGAIGGVLVDQLVSGIVTPLGLTRLVTAFGTRSPSAADRDSLDARTVTSFRYRGPSTVDVRLRAASADPSSAGVFTFTRSGLRWRLTRIWSDRLPTMGAMP